MARDVMRMLENVQSSRKFEQTYTQLQLEEQRSESKNNAFAEGLTMLCSQNNASDIQCRYNAKQRLLGAGNNISCGRYKGVNDFENRLNDQRHGGRKRQQRTEVGQVRAGRVDGIL